MSSRARTRRRLRRDALEVAGREVRRVDSRPRRRGPSRAERVGRRLLASSSSRRRRRPRAARCALRRAPLHEPEPGDALSASQIFVPSASGGLFASAAAIAFLSVVKGRTTRGFELNVTTESGVPGLRRCELPGRRHRLVDRRLHAVRRVDQEHRADAAARSRRVTPGTGLPFSVTLTSADVTGRFWSSATTYARSGKSAPPPSITVNPCAVRGQGAGCR